MNDLVYSTFYKDDESPLVQYEMTFPKKPLLFSAVSGDSIDTVTNSKVYTGATETLDDCIEWEPHINEVDKLDYIVAVSSGVLAGLIDTFYVGAFSLDRAENWGKEQIEQIVKKVAHIEGCQGDDLSDAIKILEKNHPLAADGDTNNFGGGLQHHLRDFSHHFSIGGLLFSIFT